MNNDLSNHFIVATDFNSVLDLKKYYNKKYPVFAVLSYYSKIIPEKETSYCFLYGYCILMINQKGQIYSIRENDTNWVKIL